MRKLSIILALLVVFQSFKATAQGGNHKITGTVIDGSQKVVESASISLLKSRDSSVVKIALASKTGAYEFEGIADGNYLVSVSAVGHLTAYSPAFNLDAASATITLSTLELVPQTKILNRRHRGFKKSPCSNRRRARQ